MARASTILCPPQFDVTPSAAVNRLAPPPLSSLFYSSAEILVSLSSPSSYTLMFLLLWLKIDWRRHFFILFFYSRAWFRAYRSSPSSILDVSFSVVENWLAPPSLSLFFYSSFCVCIRRSLPSPVTYLLICKLNSFIFRAPSILKTNSRLTLLPFLY